MYAIKFEDKCLKKLKKLDHSILVKIKKYIDKNLKDTENPRIHGKALSGNLKGLWRYRIENYRLIVDIQDDKLIILAVDLAHRSSVYK